MATYYINPAAGSPSWPMATPNTGATTLDQFISLLTGNTTDLQDGDIVEVMSGTITVSATTHTMPLASNGGDVSVPKGPLFRSYSGNVTRPVFQYGTSGYMRTGTGTHSMRWTGVDFYRPGATISDPFIEMGFGSNNRLDIEKCTFRNDAGAAGNAFGVNHGGVGKTYVTNCAFYNITTYGCSFSGGAYGYVYDCVFYNCGYNMWAWDPNFGSIQCYESTTVRAVNNIFVIPGGNDAKIVFSNKGTVYSYYNNFYGYYYPTNVFADASSSGAAVFYTSGSTQYDPLWVDPANGDFHFAPSSPIIHIGADRADGTFNDLPYYDFVDTTRVGSQTLGIYEPAVIPAISFWDTPSVVDGAVATSRVDSSQLVTAIQDSSSDAYFDSTAEIYRVIVSYTHEEGRQSARVVHNLDGTNLVGYGTWLSGARDGTWQKTQIKAYDSNRATHVLTRTDIGTAEDLIHSDGTMTLNT